MLAHIWLVSFTVILYCWLKSSFEVLSHNIGPDRHFFQRRTVNSFVSISSNICFGGQMNRLLEGDLLGSHSKCFLLK